MGNYIDPCNKASLTHIFETGHVANCQNNDTNRETGMIIPIAGLEVCNSVILLAAHKQWLMMMMS